VVLYTIRLYNPILGIEGGISLVDFNKGSPVIGYVDKSKLAEEQHQRLKEYFADRRPPFRIVCPGEWKWVRFASEAQITYIHLR
jgi:hypothetical protein